MPRHSRRRTLAQCAALLAVTTACRDKATILEPQPSPNSVVGCYEVRLGQWTGQLQSPLPPSRITLLDSVGTNVLENGQLQARPDPPDAPMPFDMAWYRRLESEHLDVTFTGGGEAGIRFHLVWGWGDGTWSGTAESFTDVSPPIRAIATAKLAPVACSSA